MNLQDLGQTDYRWTHVTDEPGFRGRDGVGALVDVHSRDEAELCAQHVLSLGDSGGMAVAMVAQCQAVEWCFCLARAALARAKDSKVQCFLMSYLFF